MTARSLRRGRLIDFLLWATTAGLALLTLLFSFGLSAPPGAGSFAFANKVGHGLMYSRRSSASCSRRSGVQAAETARSARYAAWWLTSVSASASGSSLPGLWGSEKAAAFVDSDCRCLASWTENFGTSAAEAAAAGIPVVISRTAGVCEWLPAEVRFEVDLGDDESIRLALTAALTSSARQRARVRGGSVRRRLGWSAVVDRQIEIYSSVITRS